MKLWRCTPILFALSACDPKPVNVLDGEEGCTGMPFCYLGCGNDVVRQAVCVDDRWTCPDNGFLQKDFNTVCAGKLGGPCSSDFSCEAPSQCGANGRCHLACPEASGRCRAVSSTPNCCDATPQDGLCGIPPGIFFTCPRGLIPFEDCQENSGDALACFADGGENDSGESDSGEITDGGDNGDR